MRKYFKVLQFTSMIKLASVKVHNEKQNVDLFNIFWKVVLFVSTVVDKGELREYNNLTMIINVGKVYGVGVFELNETVAAGASFCAFSSFLSGRCFG